MVRNPDRYLLELLRNASLITGPSVIVQRREAKKARFSLKNLSHLGKLLAELVQLLLQGGLDLLGGHHGLVDLANRGVGASADNDAPGLARGDIGAGEDDVLLVLVDCPGVGHGVAVLDHRDRLTSEDGLVNPDELLFRIWALSLVERRRLS